MSDGADRPVYPIVAEERKAPDQIRLLSLQHLGLDLERLLVISAERLGVTVVFICISPGDTALTPA